MNRTSLVKTHNQKRSRLDWDWNPYHRRRVSLRCLGDENLSKTVGNEESYSKSLEDPETGSDTQKQLGSIPDDIKAATMLNRLPTQLQLTYILFFHQNLNQNDIGKVLKLTQGAVSHRITTIQHRLDILNRKPPTVPYERVIHYLGEHTARILWHYNEVSGNQLQTAHALRLTQPQVRYRMIMAEDTLKRCLNDIRNTPEVTEELKSILAWVSYWRAIKYIFDAPETGGEVLRQRRLQGNN